LVQVPHKGVENKRYSTVTLFTFLLQSLHRFHLVQVPHQAVENKRYFTVTLSTFLFWTTISSPIVASLPFGSGSLPTC